MAKVSLRNYNRQIGTLIEEGQLEEAVGHCNHILKTFPKHLETYQMLGKAYLEAKRHQDASDVFSRLLAAVPNDFVAHVGMSMIHDENKRLDDAIWHMERAFEAQPSNAAVQSELQRLYGSRDGVQPPKIRMTSGALAQVYVQGELYPQAIAEIMSVESKDPGRADMQVLLALAYYRSGQRIEASEVASNLLSKSPYCLDANRILVKILPETSRAESTQVYRHRVNALDPYAAFAKSSIFDTSDVPDAAVSLERLDWQPGDTVFDDTGDWTNTQADTDSNKQPDWLKETDTNAEFGSASAPEPPAQPADDIPDFMRAAGWGTSSGEAEEPTSFFDSPASPEVTTDDGEPIAQAELPDWMKNIAPDQAELEAANTETEDIGDAMADDWINDLLGSDDEEKPQDTSASDTGLGDLDLGDLGTSSDEAPVAPQPTSLPVAEEDDMAWLNELGGEETPAPAESSAEPASDLPDWLGDLAGAETAPAEPTDQNAVAGDLPDWLSDLGNEEETQPASTQPSAEKNTDLPDWLSESSQETPVMPSQEPAADDDMAWLNDLATDDTETPVTPPMQEISHPAPVAEEAPITPEPIVEETPASEDDLAWMSELTSEDTSAPVEPAQEAPAEETSIPTQPRPDAVSDATIGTLGTSDADQDAAMNWLESLAANQGANPEELITDPNTRTEAAPEWVEKAKDVSESAPAAEETPATPEPATEADFSWMDEPSGKEAPALGESEQEASVAEDDLAWMNELSSEETPAPEEPVQETSAAEDDLAWMNELSSEETLAPAEPVQETSAAEDDLAWMNELSSEETSAPTVDSTDDVPEWLRETDETPAESAQEETAAETAIPTQPISDATIGTLGTSDADQDAAMNWLESLAANQGANPEELITDPNARTEAAPEWVEKAKDVSESAPAAEETPVTPEPAAEDDLSWMNEPSGKETPAPGESEQEASAAEDDLAWMNELSSEETLAPAEPVQETSAAEDDLAWMNELSSEETSAPTVDSTDDVPEWLRETDETPAEPAQEETAAETAIPTQPISDATIGTLGTSDADQDAAMNWLESLAANQGANPEELITDPNARTEAAPEWVEKAKDVSESTLAAEETPVTPEPAAEDDLSWMNEPPSEETPAVEDDLAWMNELASEEAPVPAEPVREEPTTPPAQEATSPTPAETAIPTQPISDATIGTLGTSDADQDAAMNWLESLAANQGATPEELITDPNARTEVAPEWVEKAKDVSESALASEETPATPEPVSEETPVHAEPEQEVPTSEDDLAWMNELASKETLAPTADSADDIPEEWLRTESVATPEPAPESEDDVPAWLRHTEEKTPVAPAPAEVVEEAPVAPPVEEAAINEPKAEVDEEKRLAEQAEAKLAHEAPAPIPPSSAPEALAPVTSETEADETPDWLKNIATDEETKAAASSEKTEEMPSWLADMSAEEEEKEKPAAPSNDFSAWLEDDTPPKQAAAPVVAKATKAEEWKPIEPVEEEKPEPPRDLPPRRKVNRMNTTMLRDITLMSAQAAMREGNISASLAEYGKMIKKKRLLDEAIYDLREALYDYPVDVSIWQMLGDAYMRAGRLQEAINAYTKAEELLR